jgi:hypothetical protein
MPELFHENGYVISGTGKWRNSEEFRFGAGPGSHKRSPNVQLPHPSALPGNARRSSLVGSLAWGVIDGSRVPTYCCANDCVASICPFLLTHAERGSRAGYASKDFCFSCHCSALCSSDCIPPGSSLTLEPGVCLLGCLCKSWSKRKTHRSSLGRQAAVFSVGLPTNCASVPKRQTKHPAKFFIPGRMRTHLRRSGLRESRGLPWEAEV